MNVEETIANGAYNPLTEELREILEKKTNNGSHNYFRIIIGFHLAQIASNMRCKIKGATIGTVPVNMYACGLMPSGAGKGHSLRILEGNVINQFKTTFISNTLPTIMEQHLNELAMEKSVLTGLPLQDCLKELVATAQSCGPLPYNFDSGTSAAFKQVRCKAQLCDAGALSFICDEIGSNLINNSELNSIGLEVFDNGDIKAKITKNSDSNKRIEDRSESVPTNILWFGTPAKLLNSDKEEEAFYDLLTIGYARRMFFGIGERDVSIKLTGQEYRDQLIACNFEQKLQDISDKLGALSNLAFHNKTLLINKDEEEFIYDYKIWCFNRASTLPTHESIKAIELEQRWWKAIKLAGAYAFVEGLNTVTKDHIIAALKLVEDSGEALKQILKREKPYVKLAKYIGEINRPITHADLTEELPFFKGSASARQDLINLASAWGYQNGIIIKSFERNKIPFIEGQMLQDTDLNNLIFSVSVELAYHYNAPKPENRTWEKFKRVGHNSGFNWCTHYFMEDPSHREYGCYRNSKFAEPAFNLLILDIDEGASLESAQDILKEYTYFMYTTKRHTPEHNRFRIILPMKYTLYLNADDYKQFMLNIFESLPFTVDDQTKDISRKWLANDGETFENTGELFDPKPFIPNTSLDNERKESMKKYGNVDNVTRWFLKHLQIGNRNNGLYRYAALLVDKGYNFEEVKEKVIGLNARLETPIDLQELENTVFTSIALKYTN